MFVKHIECYCCVSEERKRERERPKTDRHITSSAKRENLRSTKTQERKNMNLLPSRLPGLLVLPKPPPGICVDVRNGVPVETGHLPRRFCVFKRERVREKAFTRVNIKGRPKFKIPIQIRNVVKSKKKTRPHVCVI